MQHAVALLTLALLGACHGQTAAFTSLETGVKITDSSEVALWDYSQAAWDAAPQMVRSAAPLLTIGGEAGDPSIDLSAKIVGAPSAAIGRLLPDGRLAILLGQPARVLLIDSLGRESAAIGRSGEGPGEYRMPTQVLLVGSDTLLVLDLVRRKGVLFGLDGSPRGERNFPVVGELPSPPPLIGAFSDGTTIHRIDGNDPTPPSDGDRLSYQLPLPIVALSPGKDRYDTLFVTRGNEMYTSTTELQGEMIPIPRLIGYGVTPLVAVGLRAIWMAPANAFELRRHTAQGALMQIIRVALPRRRVTPSDQEEFKRLSRGALEQLSSVAPPAWLQAEIKKLDETRFAPVFPAVGQLVVANDGTIWASVGGSPLDTTTTWGIFATNGTLQGRATLPNGTLFAVDRERAIVRREDPQTGLLRLEVWGLTR